MAVDFDKLISVGIYFKVVEFSFPNLVGIYFKVLEKIWPRVGNFYQDLEKFDQELENFKSVRKFWNKNFQDMVTKIFFPEFVFSKTFFPRHGSLPNFGLAQKFWVRAKILGSGENFVFRRKFCVRAKISKILGWGENFKFGRKFWVRAKILGSGEIFLFQAKILGSGENVRFGRNF